MRRVLVLLLLVLAVSGAVSARARLVAIDVSGQGSKDLLYMPNGKYLKAISLGHAPLVADFVYLWAIQYYSDYDRGDRYRYVEHVFGDVIGELDPGYTDPYWLGALILTTEAQDLEAGLRLLEVTGTAPASRARRPAVPVGREPPPDRRRHPALAHLVEQCCARAEAVGYQADAIAVYVRPLVERRFIEERLELVGRKPKERHVDVGDKRVAS